MAQAGIRARVRAELTREIKEAARRQLREAGAGSLSLRAVARELEMASSAVYRYFRSRDELLTALIVDAYDALGSAVEEAEAAVGRTDLAGRWCAASAAVRNWARTHPHEYALIYGSPVPGYQAPEVTIDPASRVVAVLAGIVRDAAAAGRLVAPVAHAVEDERARPALAVVADFLGEADEAVALRAVMAWTHLFGFVSFEVFGRFTNMGDIDGLFSEATSVMCRFVGVTD